MNSGRPNFFSPSATGITNSNLQEDSEDPMDDTEFVMENPRIDGPPAEQKPRGKKRKASKNAQRDGKPSPKRYRGMRGKLEGMNEMPLDIWHEVRSFCLRFCAALL